MSQVLRVQALCYYTSPRHLATFIGTYWYIYEGQASLTLTTTSLSLQSGPFSISIPLEDIITLDVRQFSRLVKPIRLHYIALSYSQEEVTKELYLIPTRTPLTPVWKTNDIIDEWFEVLQKAVRRIQSPLPDELASP